MNDTPGTTRLTDEQTEWFNAKYAARYVTVQDNADVPSRSIRRARRTLKKKRRKG